MNLRQLEYFVAIADEGSFTRAAERLLVAQPSLSHQIRALEQELGGALLERLPRGVRLTTAGQSFISDARAAIAHAERAGRTARMALGLQAGQLEIGTFASDAAGLLPPILRAWQRRHPAVELSLREFSHRRALEEAVGGGACDLAVAAPPHDWRGPLEPLGWEEYVAVLPDEDPLLRERSIDLAALADRRWVHFQVWHGLAEVIDLRCARARRRRPRTHAGPEQRRAGGPAPALPPAPAADRVPGRLLHPRALVADRPGVPRAAPRAPLGTPAARRHRRRLDARRRGVGWRRRNHAGLSSPARRSGRSVAPL
jgi:DNA-binding transcriptional LysR family regulator